MAITSGVFVTEMSLLPQRTLHNIGGTMMNFMSGQQSSPSFKLNTKQMVKEYGDVYFKN